MVEQAPFQHAVDALRFLFNPERTTCDRPPVARLADLRRGEPGAISGLDGAATVASAEAMIRGRLTQSQMAILACRYAPAKLRCGCRADCCSGWRTNPQWREAISYVALDALYQALPDGESARLRFVTAVLLREYGHKKHIVLTDLGADLGMSIGTCSNYKRRVLNWLLRPQTVSEERDEKGSVVKRALQKGQEPVAFALAEEVLRQGGFIPQ